MFNPIIIGFTHVGIYFAIGLMALMIDESSLT